MKTKQYDLLDHSSDLNELLSEITGDTAIVITRGNTPIARLLPSNVDIFIRSSSGETIEIQVKSEAAANTSLAVQTRKPNLHPGAFVVSDDFDELLPDSFWLGEI